MLGWEDIVQQYIIKYSNRIRKATQPLRIHFGIDYFTYHCIDSTGKYTVLVDRPDWAEHYVSTKIYLNDPYLRHPQIYQSGMYLMGSHGSEEYKESVSKAGKMVLNVDTWVMLIEREKDHVEFFGFCANKDTSCLQHLYLNDPFLLKSFADYFKKELHSILTYMGEEASSLIELKGDDFFYNELISSQLSTSSRINYLKDLGMVSEITKAEKLTPREKQCLKLLIEDKSAKETAFALGLSRRTIEFYFENIKSKLDCWTKQDVAKLAKNLADWGVL